MIKEHAPQATQEFVHALRAAVPEAYFDRMTRLLYSTDASIYQMMPIGVAIPRDGDQISAAVEIAARHGVPILPRGGGSSLAGQAVGHALVLDLSRHMGQVLEIDPHARTVRTQPGITLGMLNNRLRKFGLMYGPDPASGDRATMGGILGNNSTGAHSIDYGMTADHVISTEVILADGSRVHLDRFEAGDWQARAKRPGLEGNIYRSIPEILQRYAGPIAERYPKTFRHVAGYNLNLLAGSASPNLAKLMVGSEGTLGVAVQMVFNLVPIPKFKRLAMVHFAELKAAMQAVPILLESRPTAIEVLDKMLLDLTRDRLEYRRLLTFVEGDPEIILMLEYSGDSEKELSAGYKRLQAKLKQIHHHQPVIDITDPAEQANVWYVRKVGLGILMSIRGDSKPIPFIEDAAVPVEHLAEYVTQIYDFAYGVGLQRVAMYGHASAGCLHIRPMVNLKTPEGMRQLRQIAEKSAELVVKLSGTTSGEHGEGIARGEFSERLFGPELIKAFKEVKRIFDPNNIMNPGKVVDTGRMDDPCRMRFGADYATPYEIGGTAFSFESDRGFAGAVEMCNGAGVCRKLTEGVMCPSFQATHDEKHSTRARANALRAAMMGLLGPKGMSSEELYQVMDLCLSCQACKSECPSAVDMAKIKSEFLHHYYREHGTPLRSRIFANIAKLDRLAQPMVPLANILLQGPGRWIMSGLGVQQKRSLPKLASQKFSQWYRSHSAHLSPAPANQTRKVVFFHDTFTEYNHPQVGKAAIRVLEAAGYEPIVLKDKKCCGRPAVSKGLLDQAQKLALHNLRLLAPYAERGIPIVGCEPSCMAMLVSEYLDLTPGGEAQAVAKQAMMIDRFLVDLAQRGHLGLRFDEKPRPVLFHGHCQQKANFGTHSTLQMLNLLPNCEVEMIDSGCCGMAGSFGYEKEHYGLSIQLAEMSLAPAVRGASEQAIICAMGASCRQQIHHTTGRRALHPIQVLAAAMIED